LEEVRDSGEPAKLFKGFVDSFLFFGRDKDHSESAGQRLGEEKGKDETVSSVIGCKAVKAPAR
jgi:hypothetical protein